MRFYGEVGFGDTVEQAAGVYTDDITEKSYYGDVVRATRELSAGDELNRDLSVQNSISIVADAFASENFFAIRYVNWAGVRWTVTSVQVQRPRLILTLGEVYNGKIPA
jgi:hypothetical protein